MDSEKMKDPERKALQEDLAAFRYFELEKRRGQGDRFLQPWLFSHVYATGPGGRGVRKRAEKDLKVFFGQKDLSSIFDRAGPYREEILEEVLLDSAASYLAICRDDDGFGRRLFGLMRMKGEEKEDKIIRDVYLSMLPLLASLTGLEEALPMIRALDQACRGQYPQRLEDIRQLVEGKGDDSLRDLLPPFDLLSEEESESPPGP